MKTLLFVVVTLFLGFFGTPAASNELSGNCSTEGSCDGDEALCPPDSTPALGPDGGPCVCSPQHCVQPVCRFGSHKVLKRIGSGKPGDCCDIYECVLPKEKNCSKVVCPEDTKCPGDSYRLPSHRAPDDCCSVAQGCQCAPGPCRHKPCPAGERERVVRPGNGIPGSCCPLIECVKPKSNESCLVDGKIMKNGSSWWNDKCTRCQCNNGLTTCNLSPPCPELDKSCTPKHAPDQCCPVCDSFPTSSCMSDGKIMANGDIWKTDPCTTCKCTDGVQQCQAYMCEACFNPVYVEGECCPVCNGSNVVTLPSHCPAFNNCPLRCMHGFKRDEDGCFSCECQRDQCLLDCPAGYAQDLHGNKLCECAASVSTKVSPADCPPLTGCRKTCPHGFRLNKVGCEVCKCSQCKPFSCDKNCPHGYKNNDRGCPICKCQAVGQNKDENVTSMTVQSGTDLACISSDGQSHGDGEDWFDGCRKCYCHGGTEMCNIITCPMAKCKNPVFNSKIDCCPHCAGSSITSLPATNGVMLCQSVDGAYRVEGETWQLNVCTQCLCHSGRVLCEARRCPPTPCNNPIQSSGQCCPHCPSVKMAESGSPCENGHHHHSTWRDGNCRSCICNSGTMECFDDKCPDIDCDHPVLVKNSCCSICLDSTKPKVCEVGNVTYQEDEKWSEDACTQCVCQGGNKLCTEKVCSVLCANPIKKPGKCCPVCKPEVNSSQSLLGETTYQIIICILLFLSICLGVYIARRKCRRRTHLDSDNSSHSYNNYNTQTPPPYSYKYTQQFDTSHIDLIKSPEKMALASV